MSVPLLLALSAGALSSLHGGLRTQTAIPLQQMLTTPQTFGQPMRLAHTPKIDGQFRPNEWDYLFGLGSAPMPGTSTDLQVAPVTPPLPAVGVGTAPTGPPPVAKTGITETADQGTVAPPERNQPAQTGPPASTVALPTTQLAGVQTAYMNWEPGKIYFAATIPPGHDLLLSIDGKSNGFLVGDDNLEVRITPGSPAVLTARRLLATNAQGPTWQDAPGFAVASTVASSVTAAGTFVEVALVDPGYGIVPGRLGDAFSFRIDAIPTSTPPVDAFLPRTLSSVKLVDQRTSAMPPSLKANVDERGRDLLPGDSTSIRFNLSGSNSLAIKAVQIQGEGDLDDKLNLLRVPFPGFDAKGSATIDYSTRLVGAVPPGYNVLSAVVTSTSEAPSLLEASLRVPPPVEIEVAAKQVPAKPGPVKFVATATIRSHIEQRFEGNFEVIPPTGWKVLKGTDKPFFIYDKRGSLPRGFEIEAPAGTKGTYLITLRATGVNQKCEAPFWVTFL